MNSEDPIAPVVVTARQGSARRSPSASLTERAVDTIRDRILDLTLAPGSRIDEKLLMERFRLSRTPAREALNRLAAEGLVDIEANKGAFVRAVDVSQINHFFDAYHAEERLIGFLCNFSSPSLVEDLEEHHRVHSMAVIENRFLDVARHNADFHLRIAEATENEYVIDFSARLHNHARRLAYVVYSRESADDDFLRTQQEALIVEHAGVIDAVRRGDREDLIAVLAGHARRFQERIARFIGYSRSSDFPVS